MPTRLDKARVLLRLASPRQRGLKLKEIVNRKNKRQKVWIRGEEQSKKQPKRNESIEYARKIHYAPQERSKNPNGVKQSEKVTKAIADGWEIATPYIKDLSRLQELQSRLDDVSSTLSPLMQSSERLTKSLEELRSRINTHLTDQLDKGEWTLDDETSNSDFVSKAKKKVEEFRGKMSAFSHKEVSDVIEIMEYQSNMISDIDRKINDEETKIDSIYKEASGLLDHEGLMKEIRSRSGLSPKEAVSELSKLKMISVHLSGYSRNDVQGWTTEGLLLMGKKVKIVSIKAETGSEDSAYHRRGVISLSNLRDLADNKEDAKSVLIHEMAHNIEYLNPDVVSLNAEWVASRTRESFFNPYVGRLYYEMGRLNLPTEKGGTIRATEVLSTGAEMLVSKKKASQLLIRDPEHFAITLKGLTM